MLRKPLLRRLLFASIAGAGVVAIVWNKSSRDPFHLFSHPSDASPLLETYYNQTRKEPMLDAPPLTQNIEADICVVGGGLTGLATSLSLAEKGYKVVLLEARKVGQEASGLNGGFALAGYMLGVDELMEQVGEEKAKKFYRWSQEGAQLLRKRINQYGVQCDVQDVGLLTVSDFKSSLPDYELAVKDCNETIGLNLELWDKDKVRQLYPTPSYHHGAFDPAGFAVNPLSLCLGLGRAARQNGVQIFEHTTATSLNRSQIDASSGDPAQDKKNGWEITTNRGTSVVAREVVLAGACHLSESLNWKVSTSVGPLFTYILVTKPYSKEKLASAIRAPYMVCDDKFALNYFRPLPDGRLLWGGFATTLPISKQRLTNLMIKDLHSVFPQLQDATEPETSWGGCLACSKSGMPLIGRTDEGIWYATGFGGHGVVPTTMAGDVIARGIESKGQDERYQMFQKEFPLAYVGWPFSRAFAQMFYWGLVILDRFHIWREKSRE